MIKLNLDNLNYNFELGRKKADEERNSKNLPLFIRGKCCFLLFENEFLWENYKRKDLCLKIFMDPIQTNINNYYWGDAPNELKFREAIRIGKISKLQHSIEAQKICFKHDLAPEIIDLIIIEKANKEFPCLITKYEDKKEEVPLSKNEIQDLLFKIKTVLGKNFRMPHCKLISHKDFINKKLVDFQGFQRI